MVFDLLDVHLYHGWLVSPDDQTLRDAVKSYSYNQLVEFIITHSTPDPAPSPAPASDPQPSPLPNSSQTPSAPAPSAPSSAPTSADSSRDAERALLCREFLEHTASQLTYAGINELEVHEENFICI